jgi:hypothetical protein
MSVHDPQATLRLYVPALLVTVERMLKDLDGNSCRPV